VSDTYVYPVSENQRQLWLQLATADVGSAYVVSAMVRVHAAPAADALAQALAWMIARHDALRTAVQERGSELVQVVYNELDPVDVAASLEWLADTAKPSDLERAADRPLEVGVVPLIGVTGLRTALDEHLLAIRLHHIVCDGWSLGIVVDELLGAYAAFAGGVSPQLDPVPMQFPDFTLWLQESESEQVREERLRFWREALDGVPPELDVPRNRPRPPVPDNRSMGLRRGLADELIGRIENVAAACGATVQQLLLAAFQVVLARYCSQDLFAIATVSARRDEPEFAGTVGFLANMIPVRADLRGEPTFEQLLARVRAHTSSATAYQDVSLPELLTALGVPRAAGVPPLVQVGLQLLYEIEHDPPLGGAAMTWSRVAPPEEFAVESPLDIVVTAERGRGLQLRVEYVSALYDAQFVADLIDNFITLLDAATRAPRTVVWRLDLLNPAERQRLLAWSGAATGLVEGSLGSGDLSA
jgi:transposase